MVSIKKKTDPRIGFIGLTAEQETLFEECFKQFRIQAAAVTGEVTQQLHRERFEGIVLPIGENTEAILHAARNSPSNKRVMIFAICQNSKEAVPYARYGINAVFEEPLSRQAVVKVVRATYLLIVNEYRKYLRIPIVLPVQLETGGAVLVGSSCELSAGGMSMMIPSRAEVRDGEDCTVSFNLPDSPLLCMTAAICWVHSGVLGLKFAEDQAGRDHVKKWIDDYLGLK